MKAADKAKLTKASTSESNGRTRKHTGFQFQPAPEHNLRETMKADQAKVTNASTLKSNRRKGKKSKFVSKPKQRWQVKKPTANWLELPDDITANILQRLGVFDIINNAEKVCTTWRKICKDPAMWRVISMDNQGESYDRALRRPLCIKICKLVVDRSQGQLVDLSIHDFGDYELLRYISDRSSQLKRLEVIDCQGRIMSRWGLSLKKFPLLEELSLIHRTMITAEDIDDVGRYCPLLKTFKLNRRGFFKKEEPDHVNYTGIAIAKYLPSLSHLELIGDSLNNIGLQAIMDGCTHLESLDIRQCMYIDLKKDNIGKRCSERFKDVKLPNDSMEGGYMHLVANYEEPSYEFGISFGDSNQYDDNYDSDSDGNMKEFEPWNDTQECNDYVKFYLR